MLEKFLSQYLYTIVFWLFILTAIALMVTAGIKQPKPKTMPANSPTRFIGVVRTDGYSVPCPDGAEARSGQLSSDPDRNRRYWDDYYSGPDRSSFFQGR